MEVDDYNSSLKDRLSRWTEVKGEDELLLTRGVGGSGFGTYTWHSTCLGPPGPTTTQRMP